MEPLTPKAALTRAIEVAGGPATVAKAFGISSQAVSQWELCPPARVKGLVDLSLQQVSEQDLRPDIFGPRVLNVRPPVNEEGDRAA